MAPQQHVQKPYKVLAEQYVAGMAPPDTSTQSAGLCVCATFPFADGRPHVHGLTRCWEVHLGEWIVHELWSPYDWFVIPDAEFRDRFGGT